MPKLYSKWLLSYFELSFSCFLSFVSLFFFLVFFKFPQEKNYNAVALGSSRLVPVFGTVLEVLYEFKRTNPYGGEPEDFVLPNVEQEKPLGAITIKRDFGWIIDAIGIDKDTRAKWRVLFHSIRHSFVTRVRETGLLDFVVSALSGHKTTRMVELSNPNEMHKSRK